MINLNLTDMEAGYEAFRAEILKMIPLQSSRFGFEPEITVKAAELGCRIYKLPITYYGRTLPRERRSAGETG